MTIIFSEHLPDTGYPEEGVLYVCYRENSKGVPCGCEFNGDNWINQNGEIQNKCEIEFFT